MTKYGKLKALGRCVSCQNINDTPEFASCLKCRERNRKWEKENKKWYAEHGICVRCHQADALPGKKTCHVCAAYYANRNGSNHYNPEKHSKTDKERYDYRKAHGLCTKCGRKIGNSRSTVMCNECYQRFRRSKAKAYWAKVEIPRKKRPEYGLCFICGNPYEPNGYKTCDKCREIQSKAARKENKERWLQWYREENKLIGFKN